MYESPKTSVKVYWREQIQVNLGPNVGDITYGMTRPIGPGQVNSDSTFMIKISLGPGSEMSEENFDAGLPGPMSYMAVQY